MSKPTIEDLTKLLREALDRCSMCNGTGSFTQNTQITLDCPTGRRQAECPYCTPALAALTAVVQPEATKLTEEMLARAGFPNELRRFIEDGTISHYFTESDGTLCFHVPEKDETKTSVSFHWHPEDPSKWHYESSRFYAEVEYFHDRKQYSPAGSEPVADINNNDDPNDISLLIDWLETDDD